MQKIVENILVPIVYLIGYAVGSVQRLVRKVLS